MKKLATKCLENLTVLEWLPSRGAVWGSRLLLALTVLCSAFVFGEAAPSWRHDGDDTSVSPEVLGDAAPVWQLAVVAVVAVVCSVVLLTMCLCCKRTPGFKDVCSVSSRLSRSQQDLQLHGLPSPTSNTVSVDLADDSQILFEALPDLSQVWRPVVQSHGAGDAFTGAAPALGAVKFPHSFEEDDTPASKGEAASAARWFGSPHQNFPRNQLQYVRQIGTGRFGHVLEGRAVGLYSDHTSTPDTPPSSSTPRRPSHSNDLPVPVVVKMLKEEADAQQQTAFLQELSPYRELQHRHVLRVLAVCLEGPPLLVLLQHCPKGPLKRWLLQEGGAFSQRQLLTAATDVAAGLAYMHANGFVHTDLAARNCLVDADNSVKVGDYGCSLDHFKHEYYLAGDVALPLRWCPPESLTCTPAAIHTSQVGSAGNVWSFGVVCHEVFTLAAQLPYASLTDEQVLQRVIVDQDTVPSLPDHTHYSIRALVQQCWVPEGSRPTIAALHQSLCQLHLQLYGTQHASQSLSNCGSEPVSLHLGSAVGTPRYDSGSGGADLSMSSDLETRWHRLAQEDSLRDHSCVSAAGKSPLSAELRFESDFVVHGSTSNPFNDDADLDARVAATFGTSAPSWLGLEPGQPMDSLTREISTAIQRLDDALADPPPSLGDPGVAAFNRTQTADIKDTILDDDDDLLPAFVVGQDSLVTRAPRSSFTSLSASASNLTSIGVSAATDTRRPSEVGGGSTTALDSSRSPVKAAMDNKQFSSSASYVSNLGLEDDGLSIRLEKGEFSELVKQKSRSVQDLMKLTVVDGINLDEDSPEGSGSFLKSSLVLKDTGAGALSAAGGDGCSVGDKEVKVSAITKETGLGGSYDYLSASATSAAVHKLMMSSTSSLNSSAPSTVSSTPSHSSHHQGGHFLAAANSSEPLLSSEEFSTVTTSPTHQQGFKNEEGTNASNGQDGNYSTVKLQDGTPFNKNDVEKDSSQTVGGKEVLNSPRTPGSERSGKEMLREVSQLSTPDVTVEAEHSYNCSSITPQHCQRCASSGCSSPDSDTCRHSGSLSQQGKYHRYAMMDGQDPLPDIVVHDSTTLARGSVESLLSSQDSSEEKKDIRECSEASECFMPSNLEDEKYSSSGDGKDPMVNSFSLDTTFPSSSLSKDMSKDSEMTSGLFTCSAAISSLATEDPTTNFSGQSSCELLSAESAFVDDDRLLETCAELKDDVALDLIETVAQDESLVKKDIDQPSLIIVARSEIVGTKTNELDNHLSETLQDKDSESFMVNETDHKHSSDISSEEKIKGLEISSNDDWHKSKVSSVFEDAGAVPSYTTTAMTSTGHCNSNINLLDWSVDSLPPNSILDTSSSNKHFNSSHRNKFLLDPSNSDGTLLEEPVPEETDDGLRREEASGETVGVQQRETVEKKNGQEQGQNGSSKDVEMSSNAGIEVTAIELNTEPTNILLGQKNEGLFSEPITPSSLDVSMEVPEILQKTAVVLEGEDQSCNVIDNVFSSNNNFVQSESLSDCRTDASSESVNMSKHVVTPPESGAMAGNEAHTEASPKLDDNLETDISNSQKSHSDDTFKFDDSGSFDKCNSVAEVSNNLDQSQTPVTDCANATFAVDSKNVSLPEEKSFSSTTNGMLNETINIDDNKSEGNALGGNDAVTKKEEEQGEDNASDAGFDNSAVTGEFWQQQMSAWQTAAQETRMLLLEAASSPATGRGGPVNERGTLANTSEHRSPMSNIPPHLRHLGGAEDQSSPASSSAYSPSKFETDSSIDSSPSMKKYPKTPIHFGAAFETDEDSASSSPYFCTARYQPTGSATEEVSPSKLLPGGHKSTSTPGDEVVSFASSTSSPQKRPIQSPSSSCGSSPHISSPGFQGRHGSYVSYDEEAGDDMLGYCSEDLNALRAELSLKLPVSPREKDADWNEGDFEAVAGSSDGDMEESENMHRNYNYDLNMEVEVVDNTRDHVIINYRPPSTLSPIKEEPSVLLGWESFNLDWQQDPKETSVSTYNSSIEFVDCYEDSPTTLATDTVQGKNATFSIDVSSEKSTIEDSSEREQANDASFSYALDTPRNSIVSLERLNLNAYAGKDTQWNKSLQDQSPLQANNQGEAIEHQMEETVAEVQPTEFSSVNRQQPISSSSVITTTTNEVIAVDRTSLILEDLETGEEDPEVLIYTARDHADRSQTIDGEDMLVVDVKTNEASIVEAPKPRSHLAFVHSPPPSPPAPHRIHEANPVLKTAGDEESFEQLQTDYLDDVDQDSLPYEVNSAKEKILYLKFQQNLQDVKDKWGNNRRVTKAVRDYGPKSMDYTLLSDPLCDMDFDSAWQQRSLDCLNRFDNNNVGSDLSRSAGGFGLLPTEKHLHEDPQFGSELQFNEGLTTNSPNTASEETSQSSGITFKMGLEEKTNIEVDPNVSRYQPYFTSSLNSLSQIDSSLMYGDDHVSLPYAVNLHNADAKIKGSESLNILGDKQTAGTDYFRNSSSLDDVCGKRESANTANSKPAFSRYAVKSDSSDANETFIRSEEIDLKDKVMRELGQQIESIKLDKKKQKISAAVVVDDAATEPESSDEELTSFSLGLLGQVYSDTVSGANSDEDEDERQSTNIIQAVERSRDSFGEALMLDSPIKKPLENSHQSSKLLAPTDVGTNDRDSKTPDMDPSVNYESDDYSPETDYTESNERRIYEFFKHDNDAQSSEGGNQDMVPRPVNPEPAELSDCACTPSPAISIDCSVATHSDVGGGVCSSLGEVNTPLREVNEAELRREARKYSFLASSLVTENKEEAEYGGENDVEDLSCSEVKHYQPSPVVTPGKLASIRYRMDGDGEVVDAGSSGHSTGGKEDSTSEGILPSNCITSTPVRDANPSTHLTEEDNNKRNGVEASVVGARQPSVEGLISAATNGVTTGVPGSPIGREIQYTPDWEEDDEEEDYKPGDDSQNRDTEDYFADGSSQGAGQLDSDDEEEQSEEEEDDSEASEDNSSSSGEFLWQAGDAPAQARPVLRAEEEEEEDDEEGSGCDSESGEEEFTPSTWDSSRTPTRSLLKSGSDEGGSVSPHGRSVHWKRERHHRVYEYPPEPAPTPNYSQRGGWATTPYSPPHHWAAAGQPHYLQQQQHFMQHDGFMLDDGEFFNPTHRYNFSQSTFTPADLYGAGSGEDSQSGKSNGHSSQQPSKDASDGGQHLLYHPPYSGGDSSTADGKRGASDLMKHGIVEPLLPPTHQQLQDMLIFHQLTNSSAPHQVPSGHSSSSQQQSGMLSTASVKDFNNDRQPNCSPSRKLDLSGAENSEVIGTRRGINDRPKDGDSTKNDELMESGGISRDVMDVAGRILEESNLGKQDGSVAKPIGGVEEGGSVVQSTVGELRHVREQLRLDLPSLGVGNAPTLSIADSDSASSSDSTSNLAETTTTVGTIVDGGVVTPNSDAEGTVASDATVADGSSIAETASTLGCDGAIIDRSSDVVESPANNSATSLFV